MGGGIQMMFAIEPVAFQPICGLLSEAAEAFGLVSAVRYMGLEPSAGIGERVLPASEENERYTESEYGEENDGDGLSREDEAIFDEEVEVVESMLDKQGHKYSLHAKKRMRERALLPCIIEDSLEHGTWFELDEAVKQKYNSTHVYVNENVVDIAPTEHPTRNIGNRTIKVRGGAERNFKNLVVFTEENNGGKKILSAHALNDEDLERLLDKSLGSEDRWGDDRHP